MRRTDLRRTHPRGARAPQNSRGHVHHKSEALLGVISNLISIACASSTIETLRVKQHKVLKPLRPQLHVILRSDPGSFKSTLLHAVGEKYSVTPYSSVTYPAMIGTVDQNTGKLIPGLVWITRNRPLLLDEFKTGERGDSAAVDVLLGTMEHGYYKRKVGLRSDHYYEEDGSLFYRVDNGEIEVRTRFPAIIATMKNWDMARSGKYEALTQRCIPIRYSLDNSTIDAVLDGTQMIYKRREYHPSRHVIMTRKDYLEICRLAANVRDKSENFRNVYTRAIGDLCRILSVTGQFDSQLFRLVCYLKAGLSLEQALHSSQES